MLLTYLIKKSNKVTQFILFLKYHQNIELRNQFIKARESIKNICTNSREG